jgi:hypothetical protein
MDFIDDAAESSSVLILVLIFFASSPVLNAVYRYPYGYPQEFLTSSIPPRISEYILHLHNIK